MSDFINEAKDISKTNSNNNPGLFSSMKTIYDNSMANTLKIASSTTTEDLDLSSASYTGYKDYLSSVKSIKGVVDYLKGHYTDTAVKDFLEEKGIDINSIEDYSYNDFIEKGVIDENGVFIINNPTTGNLLGIDFTLFPFYTTKVEVADSLKGTSYKEIKNEFMKKNGYVATSPNRKEATEETYSIIDNIVSFEKKLSDNEILVFTKYIENKTISELFDENGNLIIDEKEIKSLFESNVKESSFMLPTIQILSGNTDKTFHEILTTTFIKKAKELTLKGITEEYSNVTLNDIFSEAKTYEHFSEYDKIDINSFNNSLTNGLKEYLGPSSFEYKLICEYLKGKRIGDVLNKDGSLKISKKDIEDALNSYNEFAEVKKTLSTDEILNLLLDVSKINLGSYSADINDLVIEDIAGTSYGYDAIVYRQGDEYIVTNTCADGNSDEDVFAIVYSSLFLLCDNEDSARELYELFIKPLSNTSITYDEAKAYYEKQDESCYKLLEKYAAKGKISLNGYSLGGGIMFNNYVKLIDEHPEYAADLKLDLYNPFLNYFQSNPSYGSLENHKNKIEDIISKYGNNINIRCNEGDVVSQFNSITDCFGDGIKYIRSKDGNESKSYQLEDIGKIYDLIVSDESRHSLSEFYSVPTCGGYRFLKDGTQITLNEIASKEDNPTQSNDIKVLIMEGFKKNIKDLKENFVDEQYEPIFDTLYSYISDNAGNIDYDDLIDTLSPDLVKIIKKTASDFKWNVDAASIINILPEGAISFDIPVGDLANYTINDERFGNEISEFFKSDEGRDYFKSLLNLMLVDSKSATTSIESTFKSMYLEELLHDVPQKAGEDALKSVFRLFCPITWVEGVVK